MRPSFFPPLLLAALILPATLMAQAAMPRMTTVDPLSGKAGALFTVTGENLDKENIAELFLTDDKIDLKCPITEQAAASLKFKAPEKIKPGRFALMILTKGKEPKLIVQPVKVTIEDPNAPKPEEPKPEPPKPQS